jgi:hypothetical protein
MGCIAVERIGGDPLERETATAHGILQEFECQFGLGFEGQLLRYTTLASLVGMFGIKPWFGHKQARIRQSIALAARIAQIHAHLAIGDFADRAAVLCGNSDRIVALFDPTRFVNQDNAIRFAQRLGNQTLMSRNNRFGAPPTLPNEVLQIAHIYAER